MGKKLYVKRTTAAEVAAHWRLFVPANIQYIQCRKDGSINWDSNATCVFSEKLLDKKKEKREVIIIE